MFRHACERGQRAYGTWNAVNAEFERFATRFAEPRPGHGSDIQATHAIIGSGVVAVASLIRKREPVIGYSDHAP